MKNLLFTGMISLAASASCQTQSEENADVGHRYEAVFQQYVEISDEYRFRSATPVTVDGVSAYLLRYEKNENNGRGGEHFSFVVSEKEQQVLGFTLMDAKYAEQRLPSKSETEKIARNFLAQMDKSRADELQNLWIERHDEQITLADGRAVTVSGMKYKCYRASENDYAWVIVGTDGRVITFERNIRWNNAEQRRITEKWLYDD